jgi:hypothetical protein
MRGVRVACLNIEGIETTGLANCVQLAKPDPSRALSVSPKPRPGGDAVQRRVSHGLSIKLTGSIFLPIKLEELALVIRPTFSNAFALD